MNYTKKIPLLVALLWVSGAVVAQNMDHDFEQVVCKEASAHAAWVQARGLTSVEDPSFDLKYYRFEWQIDPAVYAISGTATTYFESRQNGLVNLALNLSSQLTVDAVRFHGTNIAFLQSGDYGLNITLPTGVNSGVLDSLSITYHGVPPSGGFGSFIQGDHGGTPVLWTLSEPFGAQDWWPCKNGLTDKADSIDVFITTPSQYRAASNGSLVQETTIGNSKVYHWKHRYAIAPYLVAIAVTNYAHYTDMVPLSNGTDMPMLNYVYPENLAEAQVGTADLVQVLQFYDSLFVTYPFYKEKYGHAQFGWGGGMEHQTMSFVINYSWGLLSHELAHQWFGDMVTCGSWEDIWLNEGFATFLEGLTRERFQPGTNWLNWRQSRVSNITSQANGSVRVDDTTSVNRIFNGRLSYNKGAYLLHMLRWKLGDEVFFQGIRSYLNDRKYSFSKTPSLITHLEAASGQSLTEYFNDWYYGQGYPSYQVQWEMDDAGQTIVRMLQTQSDPSVSFFEMPVPIRFEGEGQDSIVRLEHTYSGELFFLSLPFRPETVTIDPDLKLISGNNTVTFIVSTQETTAFKGKLDVQPNPAQRQLTLNLDLPNTESVQFTLLNTLGETVFSNQKVCTAGAQQYHLDVSAIPSGTYYVWLKGDSGWQTQKIVSVVH